MKTEQDLFPDNIPQSWKLVPLKEIVKLTKGKKPKNLGEKTKSRQLPYINIEAFEKRIINHYTDETIYPMCKTSDVLIVWDGARCGLVGRGVEGVIGSTLAKLECNHVNPSYLFYFLKSKYELINKRPRGVGIPHVEPNIFWNILFPLSPILEQKRIVSKLEELFTKLDAGIEYLKKTQILLKQYRQSVLKYAFEGKLTEKWRTDNKKKIISANSLLEKIIECRRSNSKYEYCEVDNNQKLFEIPKEWIFTKIGNLYDVRPGSTPSRQKKEYWNGNIPWVSSGEVRNNFIYSTKEKITNLGLENSSARLNPINTILLAMIGEGKTRGQCAILKIPAATNQNIAAISSDIFHIPSEFVYLWLIFQYSINRSKGSGGMQQALNAGLIKEMAVPLPPLEEQFQIIKKIEFSFSIIENIFLSFKLSLTKCEILRFSILKSAFEGKLVPQDPKDEPASLLLEKIKQEKSVDVKQQNISNKKMNLKQHSKQTRLEF